MIIWSLAPVGHGRIWGSGAAAVAGHWQGMWDKQGQGRMGWGDGRGLGEGKAVAVGSGRMRFAHRASVAAHQVTPPASSSLYKLWASDSSCRSSMSASCSSLAPANGLGYPSLHPGGVLLFASVF